MNEGGHVAFVCGSGVTEPLNRGALVSGRSGEESKGGLIRGGTQNRIGPVQGRQVMNTWKKLLPPSVYWNRVIHIHAWGSGSSGVEGFLVSAPFR